MIWPFQKKVIHSSYRHIDRTTAAVREYAKVFDLNPKIIYAMILVESSGDPFASRFEPGFYSQYIKGVSPAKLGGHWPTSRTQTTERYDRATSWGLMQVMGQTARELGFKGDALPEFVDPAVGVRYGAKYLRKMLNRFPNTDPGMCYREALAAYNGGPGNPNYEYAQKVLDSCDIL